MLTLAINPLAVIVATIVHQALGTLWYGPLFGKRWQAAMGRTMGQMGSATRAIVISTVAALVTALVLAVLIESLGGASLLTGLVIGLVVGVGMVATTATTRGAYEGSSTLVSTLFIGYEVVGLMLMGAIIGAWR